MVFYKKIVDFISIITSNIELNRNLTLINKRVIYNFLFNLEKIINLIITYFSQSQNFDSSLISTILDSVKKLQIAFQEYNNMNYMDKYTHTQNHWLYFFEKIGCNSQFYNLTVNEESLKFYWNGKFENTNYSENDLGEINYEIKYAILVNDTLYKTDPQEEEQEQEGENEQSLFFK